ncbi:hypothetical protein K474DRAFT_1709065 [Panus rudis PR-1116 ss-1]|nr:hypothetical protein K474DRAFT_1709065 [Panus rudis PR-1116 ss-1]
MSDTYRDDSEYEGSDSNSDTSGSDAESLDDMVQYNMEPEAARPKRPKAVPLVVEGPTELCHLIEDQYTSKVEVLPPAITFRLPSVSDLRRQGILATHETVSEAYVLNIICFVCQLQDTAVARDRHQTWYPYLGNWPVELTLEGFSRLCLPQQLIKPSLDNDPRYPILASVSCLTLRHCTFDSLQGVISFFKLFSGARRLVYEDICWPPLLQQYNPDVSRFPHDIFDQGYSLLSFGYVLQDMSIQARSLGDIWLLHHIISLEPTGLHSLVVEYDDNLQRDYIKDVLRRYVDLRNCPNFQHLTIRAIHSPSSAILQQSNLEKPDGSALTFAIGLLPVDRPQYIGWHPVIRRFNLDEYDDWLRTVVIDFRNVLPSPTTLNGEPRPWAVKLKEDLDALLTQISTLSRDVSRGVRPRPFESEQGYLEVTTPEGEREYNGIVTVVALVDPRIEPKFAAWNGDPAPRYRSEWERYFEQKANVFVMFEPFVSDQE